MEVIKILEKQTANSEFGFSRHFNAINVGDYLLSIQGSEGHYCSPRITQKVCSYDEMELAIIDKYGSMIYIRNCEKFLRFDRYDELLECSDGNDDNGCMVYGYVPVDLINDLYLFLMNDDVKCAGLKADSNPNSKNTI